MAARLALAVPYYAGVEFLREALESVRAQADARWTCVVLDDAPDKGEARACVEGLADPRITYRANDGTLGMVANWNRALDGAEDALVTLLHADDRLLPGYVGAMLALAEEAPEAVAFFCPARIIGPEGEPVFSLPDAVKRFLVPRGGARVVLRGEPGLAALMRGNFVMCPTLCWRPARLAGRRFDPRWRQVQDLDLVARLLLEGETLVGAREPHYAYRRHRANATALQTESLLRFREEYALFAEVGAAAAARGWPRVAALARRRTILRLHLAWRTLAALLRLRPGEARRTLRFLLRGEP